MNRILPAAVGAALCLTIPALACNIGTPTPPPAEIREGTWTAEPPVSPGVPTNPASKETQAATDPAPTPDSRPLPSPQSVAQPTPLPSNVPGANEPLFGAPAIAPLPGQGLRVTGHIGGPPGPVVVRDGIVFVGFGPELAIVDVSDPTQPQRISYALFPGRVQDLVIAGEYAYVACDRSGLWIVNIADPMVPILTGQLDTPGYAMGVAVVGDLVYVADDSGLIVMDVTDPAQPIQLSFLETTHRTSSVTLSDGYAFLGQVRGTSDVRLGGIQVLDLSDPAQPVPLAEYDMPGYSLGVDIVVSKDTLYAANGMGGVQFVDISDPARPMEKGVWTQGGGNTDAAGVAIDGDTMVVANGMGEVVIVDIFDLSLPVQIGNHNLYPFAQDVALDGGRAYVSASGGLFVFDISQPDDSFPVGALWIPTWPDKVDSSGNLAFTAYGTRLSVIETSQANNPRVVGIVETSDEIQDILAWDGAVLIANGSCAGGQCTGEFQTVDVADAESPTLLGSLPMQGFAVGLAADGTYAYLAARQDGLLAVDIVDLSDPQPVASLPTSEFAMAVAIQDRLAYVADRKGGLRLVGISNPSGMRELGAFLSPDEIWSVAGNGQIVLAGDRTFGLWIVDVSDPSFPVELAVVETPPGGSCEDIQLVDNSAFLAVGFDGLQVVDVGDPAHPVESGFLDIPGTATSLSGSSDRLFVAGGEGGLYVLEYEPN